MKTVWTRIGTLLAGFLIWFTTPLRLANEWIAGNSSSASSTIYDLLKKGDSYRQQGLYLVAIEQYTQVTRSIPESVTALSGLAESYWSLWLESRIQSHFESANEVYDRIVSIYPTSRYARCLRVKFYMDTNQWQSAVDDLSVALELELELNQDELRASDISRISATPDGEIFYMRAVAHRKAGDLVRFEQDRLRAERLGYLNEEFS